jgi:hypothetical protein
VTVVWQPGLVSSRRGWALPVLAVIVVALGLGAGYGIRLVSHAASTGASTAGSSTTTQAGAPPGPAEVQLSPDAAAHPRAEELKQLLQKHFNAINNHDYESWASTVVDRRSRETPKEQWLAEYATTRDGSILLHRVEANTEGLVVLLSFTSTQDAANAPKNLPGSRCTRWWVSYRVLTVRGQHRIGDGIPNSSLSKDCGD